MTDLTIPDEAQEAALQAVIDVRDASSRVPDDADSFDVTMAALHGAAPLIVAYELRQMASALDEARAEWDSRSLRYSALGHAIDELITRADELDPAGAK